MHQNKKISVHIARCPRCGDAHGMLVFHPLSEKPTQERFKQATHAAQCPKRGKEFPIYYGGESGRVIKCFQTEEGKYAVIVPADSPEKKTALDFVRRLEGIQSDMVKTAGRPAATDAEEVKYYCTATILSEAIKKVKELL